MKVKKIVFASIIVLTLFLLKTYYVSAQTGTTTSSSTLENTPVPASLTLANGPTITPTFTPTFTMTPIPPTPTPDTGWSVPLDVSENLTTNNRVVGLMMCDRYQNLHILWGDCSAEGLNTIFYRNDISDELSPPKDILSLHNGCPHELTGIASRHKDTLHMAWLVQAGFSELFYSQSPIQTAGSAKSWSEPIRLAEYAGNPSMAEDSSGTLHMMYAATNRDALNYDIMHITSNDDGKTWSLPNVIYSTTFPKPTYIQTEMAIDGRDRIYVGLSMRSMAYGLYSEVGYLQSEDNGKTWGDYNLIQDLGSAWQGVALLAPFTFGKDEVHLTWHEPKRLHKFSKDGGKTWSEVTELINLGAAFGGVNELSMDSGGNIYAVTGYSERVYAIPWDGVKWGKPELIDNRDFDPHGQHIVTCQGNHLNVVYWDRTGENTVWYSTKILDVPHSPRLPIPTLLPTLTITPNSTLITLSTPTKPSFSKVRNQDQTSSGLGGIVGLKNYISPIIPIGFGLIPALIVVISILVVVAIRNRR